MNAELVVLSFLEMMNSGYFEGLDCVLEDQVEFRCNFLSDEHPFFPGQTYLNQEAVGINELIARFEPMTAAAPDYCMEATVVDVYDKGMTIKTMMSFVGTQIGYIRHPLYSPNVTEASIEMIEGDNRGGGGVAIAFDQELTFHLNKYGKACAIRGYYWVRGKKLREPDGEL